jgi:DNA primase
VEGRAAAVQSGLPIVARLDDEVRRQEYAGLLADRAGVSASAVFAEMDRAARIPADAGGRHGRPPGPPREGNGHASLSAGPSRSPQQRVEWDALKLIAQSEVAFDAVAAGLSDDHFERAGHRRLFHLLRDAVGDVRSLVAAEDEDPKVASQLAALATEPLDLAPTADNARRVLSRLEEFRIKRQIDALRREMQKVNPVNEAERYDVMFGELARLTGAWRRARELN